VFSCQLSCGLPGTRSTHKACARSLAFEDNFYTFASSVQKQIERTRTTMAGPGNVFCHKQGRQEMHGPHMPTAIAAAAKFAAYKTVTPGEFAHSKRTHTLIQALQPFKQVRRVHGVFTQTELQPTL
jgi:hypothetical protein